MRNLSFALTTRQFRDRTKTVTRRRGTWWSTVLRPGTLLCGVEKSQGIKKGGLVRLGVIRVVSVRTEPLCDMLALQGHEALRECEREGFPEFTPAAFVVMFCGEMKVRPDSVVTRIEFEYVDSPTCGGA